MSHRRACILWTVLALVGLAVAGCGAKKSAAPPAALPPATLATYSDEEVLYTVGMCIENFVLDHGRLPTDYAEIRSAALKFAACPSPTDKFDWDASPDAVTGEIYLTIHYVYDHGDRQGSEDFTVAPLDPRVWYVRDRWTPDGMGVTVRTNRNLADQLASDVWRQREEAGAWPKSMKEAGYVPPGAKATSAAERRMQENYADLFGRKHVRFGYLHRGGVASGILVYVEGNEYAYPAGGPGRKGAIVTQLR